VKKHNRLNEQQLAVMSSTLGKVSPIVIVLDEFFGKLFKDVVPELFGNNTRIGGGARKAVRFWENQDLGVSSLSSDGFYHPFCTSR